jgi:uncharacterized protein (TIGR00251 family)
MSAAPYLQETSEGVYLCLKVQPRASRNAVLGPSGNELKLSITAPPVDSAANIAVIDFIADFLDLPRAAVQLARGNTSRHKKLFIKGVRAADIVKRVEQS